MTRTGLEAFRKKRSSYASGILFAALGILVSGCTTVDVLTPVPQDQVGDAAIDPFKNIRFWADEPAAVYAEIEEKRVAKIGPSMAIRCATRLFRSTTSAFPVAAATAYTAPGSSSGGPPRGHVRNSMASPASARARCSPRWRSSGRSMTSSQGA